MELSRCLYDYIGQNRIIGYDYQMSIIFSRTTGTGNVNDLFIEFSAKENRKFLDLGLSMEPNKPSEEMLKMMQLYPDSFQCEGKLHLK